MLREVLVLSALLCAAPALSRAAGAEASGDAPMQQTGPRQATSPAGAAGSSSQAEDPSRREETGRELQDYAGNRDPYSLNRAMPDLVRYAQSPDGRRFLSELFSGMGTKWSRTGGKGSPEEAVLSEMARYAPEDGAVWRMLAEQRGRGSDAAATIAAADNALRFGGPDAKVFEVRAQADYKLGDYDSAWRDARASLKLDPRDQSAFAVMKLAEGRLQLGPAPAPAASSSEGEPALSAASGGGAAPAAASPGRDTLAQSAVLTREAVSALALGDAASALRKADAALALDSGNAQAMNLRATAEVRLARYKEAAADATRALDLAPGNAAALTTRAWAQGRLGDYARALVDASAAVEAAPADPAARFARAFSLAGFGRNSEMLDELRTAAALHPAFMPVYERAVRAPAGSDAMLLFTGLEPGRSAPAPRRGGRSMLVIVLAAIVGGFLVALGLLQNLAGLRERFTRRLGARVSAVPEGGGGFWKRFTKVREAGSGGMGVVYEAVDLAMRRKVAVKRMREELRSDPRERRRFLEEARAAGALRHPNVVAVHGVEEEGDDLYMVCEFVEGPSLEKRLKERGPLAEAEALRLALQVCSALEAAHALRVVHGDIKPSNILLEPDGTAKVADFGLARRLDAARRTVQGASWGSPAYMAPEQEEGRTLPESDLYSLGALLYEALTGKPPFEGTPSSVLLRKREGRYEPAGRGAALSSATEALIAKALEPDPERRWRSARELSAALEAAIQSSKGS
ncbi:MAG: protein kinase [Elusimicrobiota bacterium]